MNRVALGLLVCALAFIPAFAQQPHNHSQAPGKKVRQQKLYSCPMHPEVTAKSKGKCPKCGMDLRAVDQKENVASHEAEMTKASSSGQVPKMNIPDIEVLDQNGRKIHFYTDLVKGQTVVINFIFTTCTTICPPLGATFARVKKELGDKVGRDVRFISISVDPATDTPERLKAWGEKFMPVKVGPLLQVTNHRLTSCCVYSARRPHAAKTIRRLYSSATTRTVPGRVLTAWRIPAG
jgi:SCO1/SenC/Heavy metal binding domain